MTSSELHRKLIYCGYNDLAEYLSNSPINRYIYNQLIDLLPKHQITVPIVTLFNEVYYQCVRIQFDGNPGDDVSHRYIDEEEAWLGSHNAAMLVLCLAWPMMIRKKQISFNEECFVKRLKPLLEDSEFMSVGEGLMAFMVSENLYSPNRFRTKTCSINDIPMRIDIEYNMSLPWWKKLFAFSLLHVESSPVDFNPWRKITDNFSENTIKWYVGLFSTREDQLRLLERIEKACTKQEYKAHASFFNTQKLTIRGGFYVGTSMSRFQVYGLSMYANSPHDMQYVSAGEPDNPISLSELYKQKCNEADKRCEELQKSHELEIARLEAQYKSEIEELQLQLQQYSTEHPEIKMNEQEQNRDNESSKDEMMIPIGELANYVKTCFSKTGGAEVGVMLYHFASDRGPIDEKTGKLIDGILPAIMERDKPHQRIEIPQAGQVNIGPQKVINQAKEDEK